MPMYQRIHAKVEARQLTVDNMKELEHWCKGSIKGTMLPPEERIIQIYSPYMDGELDVEVGDWIIKDGSGFSRLSNSSFHENFTRIGD